MRHWAPWIEETVGQMLDDGIERAVAIVLAPHFSSMSIAKYQAKVKAGLDLYRGDIAFSYVDAYFDADLLIDAFAARVREGIEQFPEAEQDDVHVVLSAHSLPVRILAMGDPYQDQLWTTARLIAERAGLREDQWSWSYQSEGRSPEPWLQPQLEDHVPALKAERGRLADQDLGSSIVALLLCLSLVPQVVYQSPFWDKTIQKLGKERARCLVFWWSLRMTLRDAARLKLSSNTVVK